MQRDALITALKSTDLFRSASAATLSRVTEKMRDKHYAAGQLLFSRGDQGNRLFYIISGRVRLSVVTEDGRELAFRQAAAGEIIGEVALLDGGARSADATALDALTVMTLDRPEALDLIASDPGMVTAVIAFLCRRVRDTSQQLENIALFPIEVRLARFFLILARAKNGVDTPKVLVEPRMSQSELALLIGASRPKVNAAIGQLEESGALKRQGDGFMCNTRLLGDIAGAEDQ